ncbi:Mis6-domain-containing protein [Dipodascopsis uninucleata]
MDNIEYSPLKRTRITPREKISSAVNILHGALNNPISKSDAADSLSLITVHIYEYGLSARDLELAIELLTRPAHIHTSQKLQLLKMLFPRDKVADDIVLRISGCLGVGKGKADMAVQVQLLRWIVLMYPFLRSKNSLSRLYNIFFAFLSFESLRPWICHILYLITTRKDVVPWRVQYLLQLQRRCHESQHIVGLLMLYRDFFPDIQLDRMPTPKQAIFDYPSQQFLKIIREINEIEISKEDELSMGLLSPTKRRKICSLKSQDKDYKSSVSVQELSALSTFVTTLSRDQRKLVSTRYRELISSGLVKQVLFNDSAR